MEACNFEESNQLFGPPKGMTEDEVHTLYTYKGDRQVISCWKVTQEELEEIQKTGRVWLIVMGNDMPPVNLSGTFPFEKTR